MHQFVGELLLGGARLRPVRGELESDQPLAGSQDHLLRGRFTLSSAQRSLLELGRRYRLRLDEGAAGSVVLTQIDERPDDALVAAFEPLHKPR